MIKNWFTYLIAFLVLFSNCASEERISQRIQDKKLKVSEKLRDFKTSLSANDNLSGYFLHQKSYHLTADIKDVWEAYSILGPKNMWSGPKNKFKMAYSREKSVGFYKNESDIPGPSEGMIYELKLKILKLIKIPVSFEITKFSDEEKIIEFTYGMENKSHGKQILVFNADNEGTMITHTSYIKSGKKIRDKKLYPYFHEKCIDEFHENMSEYISTILK